PIRHFIFSKLLNVDLPGVRFLAARLPAIAMPRPTRELNLKTIYGFGLRIDPATDRGMERSIYLTGTYEQGTLFVMRQILRPGDVFVDVGANIGWMTLYAVQCVGKGGKVFAFEP